MVLIVKEMEHLHMHAVVSLSTVCGKWKYEGGGAFYKNADIYKLDKTLI